MPQLPTGVISEFAHPPWGVLQRELIGTFTFGAHTLTRVRGPVNVDAFGLAWSFTTVPARAGLRLGVVNTYEDRVLQVGVRYTDISSHDFYGELVDITTDGRYMLFEQPLPTAIDIYVAPGFAVTAYWLVAL